MPNSAYLHLLLNHFPVLGTGFVLLIFFYAIIKRNEKTQKLCLMMIVLLSLITIPVFVSGNNAEGTVKGLEGIVEENIEPHQDFAQKSFLAIEILGLFSIITLFIFKQPKNIPTWLSILLFILLISVNAMMIYTAHLGGKIAHNELMNKK